MIIQPHLVYSISEVSEILKINPRTIQRVGKRHKVEKVDNRYIFKGSFLLIVFKDTIKALSQGVEGLSQGVVEVSQDIEPLLSKIKALENEIGALKMQLSIYEIEDNEVIEVFTKDEYKLFETRLIEWRYQQKEIEQKALEIQDIKTTAKEDVAHYKNLFEYQRKQSDRILQIHEKLVTSINELTESAIQRNHIEAKDKKYL